LVKIADLTKIADLRKGYDLNKVADLAKIADLVVSAAIIDLTLTRLELLMAKIVAALSQVPHKTSAQAGAALRHVVSDNGGKGLDDLLADIRGYVDELRGGAEDLTGKCRKRAEGTSITQGGLLPDFRESTGPQHRDSPWRLAPDCSAVAGLEAHASNELPSRTCSRRSNTGFTLPPNVRPSL
jgi:hypothetical protein